MKRRMHTRSFALEILEKIGNRSAQFIADESAYAVEKVIQKRRIRFKSRNSRQVL